MLALLDEASRVRKTAVTEIVGWNVKSSSRNRSAWASRALGRLLRSIHSLRFAYQSAVQSADKYCAAGCSARPFMLAGECFALVRYNILLCRIMSGRAVGR